MVKLYRSKDGIFVKLDQAHYVINGTSWDALFNASDLEQRLRSLANESPPSPGPDPQRLLPPIEGQEVWAAGVTYMRSRTARLAEAAQSGGSDFYDRVYEAERPELFFKATSHRVVGNGHAVRVRSDSRWTVPEPEVALAVNAAGRIIGYTVGNDMSARDIEGDNPLYLPQAKVYSECCALGPCLLVTSDPLDWRRPSN